MSQNERNQILNLCQPWKPLLDRIPSISQHKQYGQNRQSDWKQHGGNCIRFPKLNTPITSLCVCNKYKLWYSMLDPKTYCCDKERRSCELVNFNQQKNYHKPHSADKWDKLIRIDTFFSSCFVFFFNLNPILAFHLANVDITQNSWCEVTKLLFYWLVSWSVSRIYPPAFRPQAWCWQV